MSRQIEIKQTVGSAITRLYEQSQYSMGKAKLAKLRNSIGKSDLVVTYPFLFEMLPESLLGKSIQLSDEEKAIVWCLQLYALFQQGKEGCVHDWTAKSQNFGFFLSRLRKNGESEAIDRRFNAMILADTGEEFITHLRHLLRIFKKNDQLGTLDFTQLAVDIYCFIHWQEGKEQVRLSWSREFYKSRIQGEENHD